MKHHLVLIGLTDTSSPSLPSFERDLQIAWPDDDWAESVRISSSTQIPESAESLIEQDVDVCVILIDSDELPAGFFPFLDHLAELAVPAILLAADYADMRDRLYDDEVLVCPVNESIESVARRIHALATRQPVVRQLRRDLFTSRRCQGGLHGEINRLEEELQLAAMIQREFLPKSLPSIGDIRFGVFFRPAGYVSGDIYNIERLDETHIGFFLADAVGHGVPAALMTMVIAHSLTLKEVDESAYRILPPSEVLSRLNESILLHHADNGRFATGVYGIVDTHENSVTFAAAGHPPPLKIDRNGSYEHVDSAGGLLGVFPGEVYEEHRFDLAPGDRFFIYSDGFEMAFPDSGDRNATTNGNRRLPTLRYIEEIRKACKPGLDVGETIASLAHSVDSQPGSLHQIDDLTGICISRLSSTPRNDDAITTSRARARSVAA